MSGEDLILLYTGSRIDISNLEEFLYQNEIPSIVRDDYQSGMLAGWVPPASMGNLKLFVKQTDFLKAQQLAKHFFDKK